MDNEVMDNEVMDNEVMDNEVYTPKEPNYYNYKAKNKCLLYFHQDVTSFNKVSIVAYNINNKGNSPFLNILLHKPKGENTICFPEVPVFKNFEHSELINYSKICLFGLCLIDNFDKFLNMIVFNGFYIMDNNLYLIFDITQCNIKVNDVYNNSSLWFALIDEIVNHKSICNIKIDENTTDFFTLNEDFCFLKDKDDKNYEIPIVGFISTNKEQLMFKSVFGESSKNKNAILGPYFYFTNFSNAFKSDPYECIIRFTLFMGKTKYIENKISDPIDGSEIKQQRLKDPNLDQNTERLTMRITDHDGNWSKTHNSIYLGSIELDTGKYFKNTPIIVIKDYEQQMPLSYHYVNKKTLEGNTNDYLIL